MSEGENFAEALAKVSDDEEEEEEENNSKKRKVSFAIPFLLFNP